MYFRNIQKLLKCLFFKKHFGSAFQKNTSWFFEFSKALLKILPKRFFFFVSKTLLSVFGSRNNFRKDC